MTSCTEIEPLLAAHAFNALELDERQLVEAHLHGCSRCRQAYAKLVELPGLLELAGSAEAHAQTPPVLLEASVLAALPAPGRSRLRPPRRGTLMRSRRARWVALGAGLTVVLLALVPSLLGGAPDRARSLTLAASTQEPGARAVVRLRSHPWGTELDLQAQHLAPTQGTQIYEVWFVSPRGRVSAGTFTVGKQARVTVQLAVAARPSGYNSIGVTREPDATNPARRGPNVLGAAL